MDKIPQNSWTKVEVALNAIPATFEEPDLTAGVLFESLAGYTRLVHVLSRKESPLFAQLWGHDGSKCETEVRRLIDSLPKEEVLSRDVLTEIGQRFWGVRSAFESTRFWVEGLTLDASSFDVSKYLIDGKFHLNRKFPNRTFSGCIDFSLEPDLIVKAHTGTIGNLIDNMVRNAWTHGGAQSIWITTARLDGHALVSVSDNGTGVPQNLQDRVLSDDRFTTRASGTGGLGLSDVSQRLASFGASLEYHDRVGGGSTFQMNVPLEG